MVRKKRQKNNRRISVWLSLLLVVTMLTGCLPLPGSGVQAAENGSGVQALENRSEAQQAEAVPKTDHAGRAAA